MINAKECIRNINTVKESQNQLDSYINDVYLEWVEQQENCNLHKLNGYIILSEDSIKVFYLYGFSELEGSFIHEVK